MAISTYDELKTALADWLARDDLSNYLDDFIDLAEARHRRDFRLRLMLTSTTAALDTSTRFYNLPTGFLGVDSLHIEYSEFKRLQYMSPDNLLVYYVSSAGRPDFFTVRGSQFELNRKPDSTTNYTLYYYKQFTALDGTNTSNDMLTNHPDAYLFAALAETAPFLKDDERALVWETKYDQVRKALIMSDTEEHFPRRQPLVAKTTTFNP